MQRDHDRPISDAGNQLWVVDVPEHDSYAEITRAEVEAVIKRWFANEPLNLPLQKCLSHD